jgi:chromate transport protein ChrA
MAILVGDRLSGTAGALAAMGGMCLPGAILMYIVGVVYGSVGQERPLVNAGWWSWRSGRSRPGFPERLSCSSRSSARPRCSPSWWDVSGRASADANWVATVQRGLTPVAIGLLVAGCLTFARGALNGWITSLIALSVFAIVLRSRINPAFLVLAGALIGLLALR